MYCVPNVRSDVLFFDDPKSVWIVPCSSGYRHSMPVGCWWTSPQQTSPRPIYFSQLRIDPKTPDRIFTGGTGLNMTINGGVTVETNADKVIHSDHHLIWLDPNTPGHIIVGEDGGLAVSYDMSRTWQFIPNLPVGLFYHVNYDMDTPYNVCGGMQDNYDWCGPSVSRHTHGIMNYRLDRNRRGRWLCGVPRSSRCADRLLRGARRQHDPAEQSDGRKQEHSSDPGERDTGAGEGRSGVPLQLGHAADELAE